MSELREYVEHECIIEGSYPRVGQTFTVKYRIRLEDNAPQGMANGKYYAVMHARSQDPVEVIDNEEALIQGLSYTKWQEINFRARIVEPALTIRIIVGIRLEGTKGGSAGGSIDFVLIDPVTGQYGNREEYSESLFQGAEWHYDPAGEFVNFPDHVSPDCAKRNLEIIERIQKINSDLSDWEAVYLHYDGIQAIMAGIGSTSTTEEDIWRFLLNEGWLEKYRSGESTRQQWLNNLIDQYKGKPLVKEGGMSSQFFRNTNISIGDNYTSRDSGQVGDDDWPYIYFKGQFRYLKHKYKPTSGLIDSTTDNPIQNAVIRVRCYWSGSGGNRWSNRTETDESGNFFSSNFEKVFDSVLIGHLLCHLGQEQELEFFERLRQITAPQAQILIIDSLWNDTRKNYREKEGMQERVLKNGKKFNVFKKYYSQYDIEQLFTVNNFKQISCFYGNLDFAAIGERI